MLGVRLAALRKAAGMSQAYVAKELKIYEHTRVSELKKGAAVANGHTIKAKQIIVATHFPILNKHGLYPLKMYQHRSYVIALEGADKADGMYVDEAECGMSFRNYGKYLLLGGGGHRTGKRGGGWRELEDFYKKHYTGAKEVARWAAQDCITLDGMPYIGRYSKGTEGLLVATGFNKWGMSLSMVAASLLVDLISGHDGKYQEIFSPSRSILHPKLIQHPVVRTSAARLNITRPSTAGTAPATARALERTAPCLTARRPRE